LKLIVAAVGRLKAGPERLLFERYVARAVALGPKVGVAQVQFREIEESRAKSVAERRAAEARALFEATGKGACLCALDERGSAIASADWAAEIARARDEGQASYVVVIGGPDGLDAEVRRAARSCIAFGAMTWPHQLARILAAEQIYRCFTIMAGHPYHRA
jgi:23S rRNA (pseudouridine1915-N3)-methyltransferase